MDLYAKEEAAALEVVSSLIVRCRRIQPKFPAGSAQHTLLKNRVHALTVAKGLLEGTGRYSPEELEAALPPITSIIRKCEKAQGKYAAGTTQYIRFQGMLTAMRLAQTLVSQALAQERRQGL